MSGFWKRIERARDALAVDLGGPSDPIVPIVPSVPTLPLIGDEGDEWKLDRGWLDSVIETDWDADDLPLPHNSIERED